MGWDSAHAEALDSPERERELPAAAVVELLELGGGETVVDFGAGTGRLSVAVDAALDLGSVIAIDSSPEMYELLAQRLADRHSATALLSGDGPLGLPDCSVDRILCVDVLHHIGPRELAEMRRIVRPGARVLVIDWPPDDSREHGPPADRCLTEMRACAELAAAGFAAQPAAASFAHRYALVASPVQSTPEL